MELSQLVLSWISLNKFGGQKKPQTVRSESDSQSKLVQMGLRYSNF